MGHVLLLLVAGMCMVLSVSVAQAVGGGEKYGLLRPQAIAAAVGLVLLVVLSLVDYRKVRVLSVGFLAMVFALLFMVHIPGLSLADGGSASWLELGPVTFQPSEFAKLAVVWWARICSRCARVRPGDFASIHGSVRADRSGQCGLVVLEGDLGTAIIIAGLVWSACCGWPA